MRSYAQAQAIHDRAVLAARDADRVQLLARPRARRIRQWGQWAHLRSADTPPTAPVADIHLMLRGDERPPRRGETSPRTC